MEGEEDEDTKENYTDLDDSKPDQQVIIPKTAYDIIIQKLVSIERDVSEIKGKMRHRKSWDTTPLETKNPNYWPEANSIVRTLIKKYGFCTSTLIMQHPFFSDRRQAIQALRVMEHLAGEKSFNRNMVKFHLMETGGRGTWYLTLKQFKGEEGEGEVYETEESAKKRVRSLVQRERERGHKRKGGH